MKPTHFHTTFGFSAVTVYEERGVLWTSDGYKATSVNLRPLSELVERKVERGGWTGTIRQFLTDERRYVDGKYLPGSKRYALKRNIEFMNAQVGVFWDNNTGLRYPSPPYWNDFHSLKLL